MIRYEAMPARAQLDIEAEPFHKYELDDGTVWTEFYRSTDGYLLRFPGLADFEVTSDGTVVTAHPVEDTDEGTVEHLYNNQLVPLALSRQGRPAFHASVVTVPDGAVAFLGPSGAGKSTLAAFFALNGATFLTDDALLVEESSGACHALASHASLRLWEDSVAALIRAESAMAEPISYSAKSRILADDVLAYSDRPEPLLAAFVISSQDSSLVTVTELSGVDRYMGWLSHSFLLDIEDPALLARHFEWTHRISSAVPTFTLDYPRDYGMLTNVRKAVQQQVANNDK